MICWFANGTYRGLSWSHDSPIGLCELECVISDSAIVFRHATGRGLETLVASTHEARVLTADEAAARYPDGFKEDITGGVELGGICLIQLSEVTEEARSRLKFDDRLLAAEDIARIIVLGIPGPGDRHFGGASLFTPEQVKAGAFERAVARIENDLGRCQLPRIANGGRPV